MMYVALKTVMWMAGAMVVDSGGGGGGGRRQPCCNGHSLCAHWSLVASPHSAAEEPVPDDRYHAIYFAMLLAGVGFLLPYNSFITDVDYLHHKYPGGSLCLVQGLLGIPRWGPRMERMGRCGFRGHSRKLVPCWVDD